MGKIFIMHSTEVIAATGNSKSQWDSEYGKWMSDLNAVQASRSENWDQVDVYWKKYNMNADMT